MTVRLDIAEWVDRAREPGGPLLVCESPLPTPRDDAAQLWVFREDARSRLEPCGAGILARPEIDELVGRLRERHPVWLGRIDTPHAPPSRRFRLVWTLPPAPCRIYTRRGLALDVAPTRVTRHVSRRSERINVEGSGVVAGWIGRDWIYAGISLERTEGERSELLRLKNAGLFVQLLLMYDGIDSMVDTAWLDRVVPRVAEVLGLPWKIVDYTATPPKLTGESATPQAPAD